MTRRDLIWACAFAAAAERAPVERFTDVPHGDGYRVEQTPLTPAEVYAYCVREAERACAAFDAGQP